MTLFIRQLIQKHAHLKRIFFSHALERKKTLQIVNEQRQIGSNDCGLFAIATATAVLFELDAKLTYFSQNGMRSHLTKCFEEQVITPFPQEIL